MPKKSGAKFEKITMIDDWGNVGYFLGPGKKTPAGTWGLGDQDPAQRIKNDDKLELRTPGGEVIPAKATVTQVPRRVSDHGHSYEVTSDFLSLNPTGPAAKKFKKLGVNFADYTVLRARRA